MKTTPETRATASTASSTTELPEDDHTVYFELLRAATTSTTASDYIVHRRPTARLRKWRTSPATQTSMSSTPYEESRNTLEISRRRLMREAQEKQASISAHNPLSGQADHGNRWSGRKGGGHSTAADTSAVHFWGVTLLRSRPHSTARTRTCTQSCTWLRTRRRLSWWLFKPTTNAGSAAVGRQ